MTGVISRGDETQTGECHVIVAVADTGVMHLQATEQQGWRATPEAKRKADNRFFPRGFMGAESCRQLDLSLLGSGTIRE